MALSPHRFHLHHVLGAQITTRREKNSSGKSPTISNTEMPTNHKKKMSERRKVIGAGTAKCGNSASPQAQRQVKWCRLPWSFGEPRLFIARLNKNFAYS